MSLTELEHLRAEVARLETELAATRTPGPPPQSLRTEMADAVGRMGRSIEILTAILDGPTVQIPGRLRAIGADEDNPTDVGMVSMAMTASTLLESMAEHAREHGVVCGVMDPLVLVRKFARATSPLRDELSRKAGG